MSKLPKDFIIELKKDIPDMILYCIPNLPDEDWVQLYNMDKDMYIVYGNRIVITEYINDILEKSS